jgi:hypothetical protein
MSSLKSKIEMIKSKEKVSSIACSRIIKTREGDVFMSLTSSYGDLPSEGLTVEESRVAALLLSLQVNQLALKQAAANHLITADQMNNEMREISNNYKILLEGEKDEH